MTKQEVKQARRAADTTLRTMEYRARSKGRTYGYAWKRRMLTKVRREHRTEMGRIDRARAATVAG